MQELPLFPNYLQLRERSRVPMWAWRVIRAISVLFTLALIITLFVSPDRGLTLFWGIIIPVAPLIFLVAPGIWRNMCPLAATNQTARVFNFGRGLSLPDWAVEYVYVIGIGLFLAIASSRKWLFNQSGPATGTLILGFLTAAFIGGFLFKGKSGWCSSICPMLPIERIYNQTPFFLIPNSHCSPCVGCTKNCYDFNPSVANLADLYDDDRYFRNYRKFFMGAFPGFILAFFTVAQPPAISIVEMYLGFGLYVTASVGTFFFLDAFVKVSTPKITTLYGAAAFNIFYWFVAPAWFTTIFGLFQAEAPSWTVWLTRVLLLGVSVAWIARSYAKEPAFVARLLPGEAARVSPGATAALKRVSEKDQHEITFMPEEKRILVKPGISLLDAAERAGLPVEPGCRMGVCGADPIAVLSGEENLAEVKDDERATLERLGLGGSARMACMARIDGSVTMTLDLSAAKEAAAVATPDFPVDPNVQKVVIVGNGIAGVTAADFVRRYQPDCEVHLVSRESHHLYNRMAITRLIYGRSAMNGLYLQPDAWYADRGITCWLNTRVQRIDPDASEIRLAIGTSLPYDRLILATGSSSFVPPVKGFGVAGSFVLREAEDAMGIRAYVQEHYFNHAVVAGGGLLGLEAAYALNKLGLHVSVLERSPWLLRRQLDQPASQILRRYLEGLGMDILLEAEAAEIWGNDRVEGILLKDGRRLYAGLILVAAGIRPNVQLAKDIDLATNRGIVVDEHMRTSANNIYAAGDVCEVNGRIYGLWPMAVEQAKVAAVNALGGGQIYQPGVPATMLKVVGIELTSVGRIYPESDDDIEIAFEDVDGNRYRKLLISEGKIVGTILLGYPEVAPIVTAAIKDGVDVGPHLQQLRQGEWDFLNELPRQT